MRFGLSFIAALCFAASSAAAQQASFAPPVFSITTTPTVPQPVVAPYATAVEIPTREIAGRQQRYFVFTTGNAGDFTKGGLAVPAGDYLNAYVCNISGGTSGIASVNAFITERIFDSSGTVAVPYGGISSPVALTTAMTSATPASASPGTAAGAYGTTFGSNIVAGAAASPAIKMVYGVGTIPINNAAGNAVPSGVGYVYPSTKNELHELRIIPPQTCFGQYVAGLPAALGSTTYYEQFRFYGYME